MPSTTVSPRESDQPPIFRADARRYLVRTIALLGVLFLMGCDGPQSALDPAGRGAEQVARLFWWMAAGAAVIWVGVVGLAIYTIRFRPEVHYERQTKILIIGGGVAVPTLTLTGLLIYGLALLPEMVATAPAGSLTISVTGEQWWWRMRYHLPNGGEVHVANEIRIPVGEPVQFHLFSPDVIHSFWIPSLGGKIDMIPGRMNRLALYPTRAGVYRGVCAEYCGTSHALMNFDVVVMEKEEFNRWLAQQAQPAIQPTEPERKRGQEIFLSNGCGACHTIRGTTADGMVGPDLTHVGGRLTLGAGILPNNRETLIRWIAHTDAVKPEVHMPAFGMLPQDELRALAAYLESLK